MINYSGLTGDGWYDCNLFCTKWAKASCQLTAIDIQYQYYTVFAVALVMLIIGYLMMTFKDTIYEKMVNNTADQKIRDFLKNRPDFILLVAKGFLLGAILILFAFAYLVLLKNKYGV